MLPLVLIYLVYFTGDVTVDVHHDFDVSIISDENIFITVDVTVDVNMDATATVGVAMFRDGERGDRRSTGGRTGRGGGGAGRGDRPDGPGPIEGGGGYKARGRAEPA